MIVEARVLWTDVADDPGGSYALQHRKEGGLKDTFTVTYKGSAWHGAWGVTTKNHRRGPAHVTHPRGVIIGAGAGTMVRVSSVRPKVRASNRKGDLVLATATATTTVLWRFDGEKWRAR